MGSKSGEIWGEGSVIEFRVVVKPLENFRFFGLCGIRLIWPNFWAGSFLLSLDVHNNMITNWPESDLQRGENIWFGSKATLALEAADKQTRSRPSAVVVAEYLWWDLLLLAFGDLLHSFFFCFASTKKVKPVVCLRKISSFYSVGWHSKNWFDIWRHNGN